MLDVSRSAYYRFIQTSPSKRTEEHKRLLKFYAKNRRTYGSLGFEVVYKWYVKTIK